MYQLSFTDCSGHKGNEREWVNEIIQMINLQVIIIIIIKNQSYIENKKSSEFEEKGECEDCRIHLCLYFINCEKISTKDFQIMKVLSKHVNIIPIIVKVTKSHFRGMK